MIVTIVIALIAVLLGYIYYVQSISKFGRLINKFPGPNTVPFLGNVPDIQVSPVVLFQKFRELALESKKTYRLWVGNYATINIVTAEDAEIILTSNKHIKKSVIYEFLHGWLGTGLLTSTGQKWQHRRKLLTPSFHFNILRKFAETFGEHAQNLVEDLKKECTKSKTDISPLISQTTLHAICETAMGYIANPNDKDQRNYFQAIYEQAGVFVNRFISPWLYIDFIFNITPTGWKEKRLIKHLHKFTYDVIKEREANFEDSDVQILDQTDDDGTVKKKKLAMLDLLLSAKRKNGSIDDEGIREEVDTFMFEGHDTTTAGICFALLILANQEKHQEKIVQELKEIFGDSKRPAKYEDLQKMTYLELCLKECLRLFPSVPLIGRVIEEDMKLSEGVVPAGTLINIHIYDLHHDPKHFPDPNIFDPDRFLPENSKGRHPFAYVPFSAGPRNCIGQKYAMLEMKSIISAILRNFTLESVDTPNTINLKTDFVLRNEGEINIKFKPRIDENDN